MKVLLVKPYNISDHIQPSLGLGYLATAIRDKHSVKILDCIKEGITAKKFPAFIKKYKPDVVGFQCYTFDLSFVNRALKTVRRIDKGIVTIVGGPHPSAMPEEMMDVLKKYLDFAFVGEAETGLPQLLDILHSRRKDYSAVPGLAWRSGTEIRINPKSVIDDLDKLGLPAWDLICPEKYPESQHGAFFKQFPIAPIMVTRGCPFPCTFCAGSIVSGRKIRRRSIDHVLGELSYLNKKRGIKEFHIIDDNFTMDKAYAKEFLKRLKALNLGMTWSVPNGVRMDTLDKELLELMKETGLYMVSLGIESGSDDILKLMKKGITTSQIRRSVHLIHKAGIDMAGFFIIGFPGETKETIKQTIRFAAKLPLKRANFFTYLPFPGSESYRELKNSKELEHVNWKRFYFTNAAYVPKGMTRRELKKLHRAAFAKFYLRPRLILYQLMSIQSLRHFLFLFKRFCHWIVFN